MKKVSFFSVLVFYSLGLFGNSTWFSESKISSNSKIYRQIQFLDTENKKKFIFYELSWNQTRKWEELRIQGLLSENHTKVLKAEKCSLFAKKDMEKRWVLIRAFDCEHLEWEITLKDRNLFLKEKNEAFEEIQFDFQYQGNLAIFKVIEQNEDYTLAWGFEAKKVYKAKQGKVWNQNLPIPILSVRESTIYFKPYFKPIEYVEVEQPKGKSFLEE